ncbi:RagB/SusD family nutrient uptake outer membrane protein [Puteibacter caeruleilacunae]|nr:RagB/SusD family nutrient uptake outer membrane protein [Puteibacter caeruleilacunae]
MKNLLYISIILLTGMLYASCEKLVEVDPDYLEKTEDYFDKKTDIDNAARGMYDGLQNAVEHLLVWGEVRGDLVRPGTGAQPDLLDLFSFQPTSTNKFCDWGGMYDVINRANLIIKYAKQVEDKDFQFSEDEKAQYEAEAKNVRALCYFYLVRTFGDVPLILEPYESITDTRVFNPVAQETVLDTIMYDLKAIEGIERTYPQEVVDGNDNSSVYTSRMKAITNLCLQADVHLWRNEYELAVEACEKAINWNQERYSIGTYQDANVCYGNKRGPKFSWYKIFAANANLKPESIFELQFQYSTPDLNILQEYTAKRSIPGGKYVIKPSVKCIEAFEEQVYRGRGGETWWGDYFRGHDVSYKGIYNKKTHRVLDKKNTEIFKYQVMTSNGSRREEYQSAANWIVYRIGDLYLMYAEALNRAGRIKEALLILDGDQSVGLGAWSDFNVPGVEDPPMGIRKRVLLERHLNPESDPLPDMLTLEDWILEERALELAFEGKRWFDLVRVARRGRPEVLVDNVLAANSAEDAVSIGASLAEPANWFLPYHQDAKKYFTVKVDEAGNTGE